VTETSKLIFPDEPTAREILTSLNRRKPASLFTVVQIPQGWQVCRVHKCPAYMPAMKPAPVVTKFAAKSDKQLTAMGLVKLTFPLVKLSAKEFTINKAGIEATFKLDALLSWSRNITQKTITFTVPEKWAKDRNLLYAFKMMQEAA